MYLSPTVSALQHRTDHPCTVCDSTRQRVLYTPWRLESDPLRLYGAASGIPGTQRLVRCTDCGMIFESPRYGAATVVDAYAQSREGGHDSQYPMRVRSFSLALKRHSRLIPPAGAAVLDVGTAGGAFLEAAARFGYSAYGLEPSEDLVDCGRRRGLNIEQGTIEDHGFHAASFDMVCLWDVIEHVPNPKTALREARRLLKPSGILLINYPDIGTLQARLASRRFWWLLSNHLHYFTRESITGICRRTGFEVFHFQRYWQILEFGYLEHMAAHYRVPLARRIADLTPAFVKRLPIPYYASQTTALARLAI